MAPQLIGMNSPAASLMSWMDFANNSFPTPVSPVMSIFAFVFAAFSIWFLTCSMTELLYMIFLKLPLFSCFMLSERTPTLFFNVSICSFWRFCSVTLTSETMAPAASPSISMGMDFISTYMSVVALCCLFTMVLLSLSESSMTRCSSLKTSVIFLPVTYSLLMPKISAARSLQLMTFSHLSIIVIELLWNLFNYFLFVFFYSFFFYLFILQLIFIIYIFT